MTFSRGDVVLVLYPDSNLRTAKRRPALVIQSDALRTDLPQTIVSMISGNLSRQGPASRIPVSKQSPLGKHMGLLTDSVIVTDNLATVRETEIDRVIGSCDEMKLVDAALRETLSL